MIVNLQNHHLSGGKRQVSVTETLTKPLIEALKEAIRDVPQLEHLFIRLHEVESK